MLNQDDRERPAGYLREAIEIFMARGGGVIVEIGSMRMAMKHPLEVTDRPCCNDGHSTMYFAQTGQRFHTVEIDGGTVRNVQKHVDGLSNVTVHHEDGLKFLAWHKSRIDFLYLDAWDANTAESATKHVAAYKMAHRSLTRRALVMIDDTDVDFVNEELILAPLGEYGGKGRKLIPLMLNEGWRVLRTGRCTLLSRMEEGMR